ncbi:GAF domain-containing protein [Nocardia arthritidis]|uniref:Rv3651-like N-terminal domain-containing protein n=1 Tax=Nocardia arthritidis TaxID=228602 RepID=A0A6G9Y6T0_9NOCA|nr:GAF domain-containing protein [Nocardia arthritidis]QIS08776.1 hypothetical protein F5544_04310 [Nocardia arthritidis]
MCITRKVKAARTPWTVVETLDPAVDPTVVSHGGVGRDFVVLERFLQRAINAARMGTAITPDSVSRHIVATRDRGEPTNALFGQGKNKWVLHTLPVMGPQNRVHGVQFWLGPVDEDPPEPHRVTGVTWDLPNKLVHLTADCTRMSGTPDEKFTPELPLAMFWRSTTRFDHHEAVFNLLYNPHPHGRLQSTGTVQHADGHEMLWQATIRARHDHEAIGAWALLEDLTSDAARPLHPTLEQEAFREYHRTAGTYLGVVHIADGTVVTWLTDPPPWIDWNHAPDEIFPPEDRARLATAVAPDEGVVRALNHEMGYTPTRIVLSPYRGCRGKRLAIGQFFRADDAPAHGRDYHANLQHRKPNPNER